MEFPKNLDLKPMNILKFVGLALVAIILIAVDFRLIGSSFTSFSGPISSKNMMGQGVFESDMSYSDSVSSKSLSTRNVASSYTPRMDGGATMGNDAEEFEVTEYNANVETRHLDDTCTKIASLKLRDDVIFENANKYEKSCSYNFKVENKSVEEVLAIIETLDPKDLNERTYTIKRLIDDYTSEVEILKKKMISIEETLDNAVNAYDSIAVLAEETRDAESLAKIIDSKIRIIERLTQERINVNAQLERLNRSKAEQLDRLEYTYFNVYILENKFIDGENLKDSWKASVKLFVRDINKIAQDITINLISLLFLIFQYVIYFFIILIVAKYGWKFSKSIWKK
ncbi:hypothetical protein K8R62_03875 [bacterium]|nr:hypothetical protein [bacterium]